MVQSGETSYRQRFPWLQLFRSGEIALSPAMMVVSALALFAMSVGDWLGDSLLMSNDSSGASVLETSIGSEGSNFGIRAQPVASTEWSEWVLPATVAAKPWMDIVQSSLVVISRSTESRSRAVFDFIWALSVWSLSGLMICRMAGIRFSRDEGFSIRNAVRFGVSRWFRAISSPLIPLTAASMVTIPLVLLALLGRLPLVGTTCLVLASPVMFGMSFLVVSLLLAAFVGWPLMIAAICADDCDGFGALSRSYSFWAGKPAYFVWCVAMAFVFETALHSLFSLACGWSLAFVELIASIALGASFPVEMLVTCVDLCAKCAIACFGLNLFWVNSTICYLLLRLNVDKMPVECLADGELSCASRDPLPVVGMPAMQIAHREDQSVN